MSSRNPSLDDAQSSDLGFSPGAKMTEEQFVAWCNEDARAEWIDGEVVMMSPTSVEHGDLIRWLGGVLGIFVEQRDLGIVLGQEIQVRLAGQRRRYVPDLLFVAKSRGDILRVNHVEGAPDLVVEIVSPESVERDWREKYLQYQVAGVKEYWIIEPATKRCEVYAQHGTEGYQRVVETEDAIASTVLPDLNLKPQWLWRETRPKVLDALRQLGIQTH